MNQDVLIQNLSNASYLINSFTSLYQEIEAIKRGVGTPSPKPYKRILWFHYPIAAVISYGLMTIIPIKVLLMPILLLISVAVTDVAALRMISKIFVIVLFIALTIMLVVVYKNTILKKENEEIRKYNNGTAKQYSKNKERQIQAQHEYAALKKRWMSECASWYPPDYTYSAAADFFLASAKNHRGNSVGSLVNLYEEYMANQRQEQLQKDILRNARDMHEEQMIHNFIVEDFAFRF